MTQIAAATSDPPRRFNVYVLPNMLIADSVSQIAGLCMVGQQVTLNGTPVTTAKITEAVDMFLKFISHFENVVLVAACYTPSLHPVLKSMDIREM